MYRDEPVRMTYVQIFTGGQPIDPAAIEAAGVRALFGAEVDGWTEPPVAPKVPSRMKAADMPPSMRKLMAKAMCKMLEQATGFKVIVHT